MNFYRNELSMDCRDAREEKWPLIYLPEISSFILEHVAEEILIFDMRFRVSAVSRGNSKKRSNSTPC